MGLVQKSFSDIITFSRSSNATRVGPTGVLEYAPHNLLVRSQEFDNASWTKAAGATVTANSAAAPDGTITADLVATDFVYQGSLTYSVATLSVYVKAGTSTDSFVYMDNSGAKFCRFNVTTGVITATASGYSSSITSVGNGWYRITFTGQISGACGFGQNGSGNGYFWGAQLSVGPYALDYTPTTSAAVYGPRFDYDGSGVTIVEPVSTNLVTYSEDFSNAAWTKTDSSVTSNAIAAPDGTVTADKIVENSANAAHYIGPTAPSVTSGVAYTISVYGKAAERSVLQIVPSAAGFPVGFANFDLSNGVIGSFSGITSYAITSVGNGWYRCSVTVIANATTTSGFILVVQNSTTAARVGAYTGDGTSGIYAWGAQLEVGSTATAYMVSGATNGFRAVPVVSGSATARGLLVEEQRTNLLLASNDFSNVTYWTGGGSVTANATTSPDGTVNAAIGASINPASGVGDATVAISGSIFAKANPSGASSLVVRINRFGSGIDYLQVTFNLSTGVAGAVTNSGTASGGSASMIAFGNGWYRCVLSGTVSTTAGTLSFNPQSTCFIYGAQLEAGSFATSYIPTLASTVTRSADVASVNTLSPWFNATEGTLFSEFDVVGKTPSTTQTVVALTDALAANYALLYKSPSDNNAFEIISGGVSQANLVFSSPVVNTTYKLAGAYKANDFAAVENGGTVATDTSGSVPSSVSYFGLGYLISGFPLQLNGHLRRVAYYPVRLTNAQLQALTS